MLVPESELPPEHGLNKCTRWFSEVNVALEKVVQARFGASRLSEVSLFPGAQSVLQRLCTDPALSGIQIAVASSTTVPRLDLWQGVSGHEVCSASGLVSSTVRARGADVCPQMSGRVSAPPGQIREGWRSSEVSPSLSRQPLAHSFELLIRCFAVSESRNIPTLKAVLSARQRRAALSKAER